VSAGKNTKGGEGKARDTWLPDEVESLIYRYSRDLQNRDSVVDKSKRTVQRWVTSIAEELSEETGDEDWKHISSHDLRRYWANKLLVEERINVRVVMSLGGWNDYQAIKPYLNRPTEAVIVEEMQTVEI
jgi:integrase